MQQQEIFLIWVMPCKVTKYTSIVICARFSAGARIRPTRRNVPSQLVLQTKPHASAQTIYNHSLYHRTSLGSPESCAGVPASIVLTRLAKHPSPAHHRTRSGTQVVNQGIATDYIKQPACPKAWRDPQKRRWQHLSTQAAQHFHTRDAIGNLVS